VKWQSLLVTFILIAAILVAGCTDEENPLPRLPSADAVLPGQELMVIGNVSGNGIPGGSIDNLTFTVGLIPGKNPFNMENISIIYADAVRTESLVPVEGFRGDPPPGHWGILEVQNMIGAPNNRIEYEEQFVLRINPKSPLLPNQFIMIIVKTSSGTPLTIRRVSPPTIIKENNILSPI
jgi:archaellin